MTTFTDFNEVNCFFLLVSGTADIFFKQILSLGAKGFRVSVQYKKITCSIQKM